MRVPSPIMAGGEKDIGGSIMDLNDLRSVVAVHRFQSFSEAAVQLDYTTSAVSKHVQRVEKERNLTLFRRGDKAKPAALTDEGAAVIGLIQRIVDNHTALLTLADSLRDSADLHPLRVGYPPLIGTFGETEILNAYIMSNQGG